MATDTATETTPSEAPAPEAAKPKRALNGVYVSTPKELREKIEEEAKASNQSTAGFVRNMLAARYGLTLPAVQSIARKKYDTPEQRKEAQKAQRQSRNELVKELLKRHKAELEAAAAQATATAPAAA